MKKNVRMFRWLAASIGLCGAWLCGHGQTVAVAEAGDLQFDQTIERQISTGQTHQYKLQLKRGQVLFLALDELNVNLTLAVARSTGAAALATADLGGGFEAETLTFVADGDDAYVVKVTEADRESGQGAYRLSARRVDAATEKEQARIKAETLLSEAVALSKEGMPDKFRAALARREQALTLWRSLGDRYWESQTLKKLGELHQALMEYRLAIDCFNQSLAITRELGDRKFEAITLLALGVVTAASGDRPKANDYYTQSLQLLKGLNSKLGEAMLLYWLANNGQLGDRAKALDYFNQTLLLAQATQNQSWQASALMQLGLAANAQNDKQKALDFYNQALPLWRSVSHQGGEAWTLASIGKIYAAQDDQAKAFEYLSKALALSRTARDKGQEMAALNELVLVYWKLGQSQQAIDALQQVIAYYHEFKFAAIETALLGYLSTFYVGLGKYQEAIATAQAGLAIEETVADGTTESQKKIFDSGMKRSKAICLVTLGQSYYNLGDSTRAELFYNRALESWDKDDDQNAATSKLNIHSALAELYRQRHELDKALESFNRALAIAKAHDRKPETARVLNSLGLTYNAINEKLKALDFFQQSLTVSRSLSNKNKVEKRFEAGALDNIGQIYLFLGEPLKALDYHQQALTVYKEINDPIFLDEEATTYSNIASVHHALGEYQKALDTYKQSLGLFQQAPPHIKSLARNRTHEANLLVAIGSSLSALGDKRAALEYFDRALRMAIDSGDQELEATTKNSLGNAYTVLGDNRKALEYLNQSLALHRLLKDRLGAALVLNNIGHVHSELSEYQEALACFEQALPVLQELGDKLREGVTLNNIGDVYSVLAQKQKSLDYLNKALAIFVAIGDKSSQAVSLNNIAEAKAFLGENQNALEVLNQALSLTKTTGEKTSEASTLNNLGGVYSDLGETAKAFDHYNQALELWRQVGYRGGEATALGNLAAGYFRLGEPRKALAFYTQSLEIVRAVGDRNGEATVLKNLGSVHQYLGEKQAAMECYNRSLAIRTEIGDRSGEATTLNAIGGFYLAAGEIEPAFEHFNRAWKIAREIGETSAVSSYLNNIARLYSDTGERAKAIQYSKESLDIDRQIGSKSAEALTLNNIAFDYLELGDTDKALDCRRQALQISRETGDKNDQVGALLGFGSAYRELGERDGRADLLKQALENYEQALELSRQIENKEKEAAALIGIGRVQTAMGQPAQALLTLRQALELSQKYQNRMQESGVRLALGRAYQQTGELQNAVEEYEAAAALARAIGDKDDEARAFKGLMIAWKARGNSETAILYGKQAINKYQELRSALRALNQEAQDSYLEKVADTYRILADLLFREKRLQEAQRVLDLLKAEEYSQLNSGPRTVGFVLYSGTEAADLKIVDQLVAIVNEQNDLTAKLRSGDLNANEQQRLNQRSSELREEVVRARKALAETLKVLANSAENDPELKRKLTEQILGETDVRNLGLGTVALYTLISKDSGWIKLITPDFTKAYPIEIEGLEQTIIDFQTALSTDRSDPRPLAQKLYRMLLQQTSPGQATTLETDLNNYLAGTENKTLMWSLDGALRYIPMAALYDGNHYLIERYRNTVFIPESISKLGYPVKPNWNVLGLGVSQAIDGAAPLPGAERELRAIVREHSLNGGATASGILPGKIRLNADFTFPLMITELGGDYAVVHIATHYTFFPNDMNRSFLLLGDGRHLTLGELEFQGRIFGDVDLLALSACDTANVKTANGTERESLAVIAQKLGAKSVIASLWPVNDLGTDVLMEEFYRLRQAQSGMTKGDALRQAQLTLLNGRQRPTAAPEAGFKRTTERAEASATYDTPLKCETNAKYCHPHYWAPFILIGNWK